MLTKIIAAFRKLFAPNEPADKLVVAAFADLTGFPRMFKSTNIGIGFFIEPVFGADQPLQFSSLWLDAEGAMILRDKDGSRVHLSQPDRALLRDAVGLWMQQAPASAFVAPLQASALPA